MENHLRGSIMTTILGYTSNLCTQLVFFLKKCITLGNELGKILTVKHLIQFLINNNMISSRTFKTIGTNPRVNNN